MDRGIPRGVVTNMLKCDIAVSEFKLQSRHPVHFRTERKDMNFLIPPDTV